MHLLDLYSLRQSKLTNLTRQAGLLKLPRDRLAAVLNQSMLERTHGYMLRQPFWLGQLILSTISLVLVLFYLYFTTTRLHVNDRSFVSCINYIILVFHLLLLLINYVMPVKLLFQFWELNRSCLLFSHMIFLLLCSCSKKLLC